MNNLNHLAIFDDRDVFFAHLESFELHATSYPGRYLLTGFIGRQEVLSSVFCTSVKNLKTQEVTQ